MGDRLTLTKSTKDKRPGEEKGNPGIAHPCSLTSHQSRANVASTSPLAMEEHKPSHNIQVVFFPSDVKVINAERIDTRNLFLGLLMRV